MDLCWNDEVVHKLMSAVRKDQEYQKLLTSCNSLEEGFCRIKNGLSENDRDLLDSYIAVCEDMQYRMTQLAYEIGRFNNQGDRTT